MVTQSLCQISYQGGFVLIPLMLSQLYGYTATHISLLTIGRPLMWGLAGPLSAWLVRAAGPAPHRGGRRARSTAGAAWLLTRIGPGTGAGRDRAAARLRRGGGRA